MEQLDNAFEMASSNVRFGAGVTREVGWDLSDWGIRRVAVFTDENLVNLTAVQRVLESLDDAGSNTLFTTACG